MVDVAERVAQGSQAVLRFGKDLEGLTAVCQGHGDLESVGEHDVRTEIEDKREVELVTCRSGKELWSDQKDWPVSLSFNKSTVGRTWSVVEEEGVPEGVEKPADPPGLEETLHHDENS